MTLDRRAWKTLVDASHEDTISTVLHDLVKAADFDSVKSALDAGVADQGALLSTYITRFSAVLQCLDLAAKPDMYLVQEIVEAWASKLKPEHYSEVLSKAAAAGQLSAVRFLKDDLGADPYGPAPGNSAIEIILSSDRPSVDTLIALVGDDPITSMEQLPKTLRHSFSHRGQQYFLPCNMLERAAALGKAQVVEWLATRIAPGFDEPYHSMCDLALTISGASSEADLSTRRGIWTSIPSFGNLLALGAMPRTGLEGWKAMAQVPVNTSSATIPFDIASSETLRVISSTVDLVPFLRRLIVEGAVGVDESCPRTGNTLLQVAAAGSNIGAIRMLLEMGADASLVDPEQMKAGKPEELVAARQMIRAARAHRKVRQALDSSQPRAVSP
jgi:hypothetical protein